jgi:hypothetical protein
MKQLGGVPLNESVANVQALDHAIMYADNEQSFYKKNTVPLMQKLATLTSPQAAYIHVTKYLDMVWKKYSRAVENDFDQKFRLSRSDMTRYATNLAKEYWDEARRNW